jgi:hypothetical protein
VTVDALLQDRPDFVLEEDGFIVIGASGRRQQCEHRKCNGRWKTLHGEGPSWRVSPVCGGDEAPHSRGSGFMVRPIAYKFG